MPCSAMLANSGLTERLHVTGFQRDVARVLSIADVLVFPSLQPEGFGRPIIEAMALARPVVATDVGPSAELLGNEPGRPGDWSRPSQPAWPSRSTLCCARPKSAPAWAQPAEGGSRRASRSIARWPR